MSQVSPSVLVIRLDGIGDALALAPLIAALQANGVAVDVVLCERNAGAFAPAALRHVEIAPFALRSSRKENCARIAAFAATLRERSYDAVLVATEDPSGYLLARAIDAPRSIGFANGLRKPFKTLWVRSMLTTTLYRPARLDARGLHECETLFELGQGMAAETHPTHDLARLRPLLLERAVERGGRLAVQVTEKWQRFGIPARDVGSLLHRLSSEYDVHAIAAARESRFADAVEEAWTGSVERYDAVEPWKEAIAAAMLLVAPDSGATHVAGMTGTPTAAIFPAMRNVDRQIARWHPWAAPYRAITLEPAWEERTYRAIRELAPGDRA